MEGVARNSALVDPAGCVKITEIDQHALLAVGNGVARTVVVSHRIHHGGPTTDRVMTAIEQVLNRVIRWFPMSNFAAARCAVSPTATGRCLAPSAR